MTHSIRVSEESLRETVYVGVGRLRGASKTTRTQAEGLLFPICRWGLLLGWPNGKPEAKGTHRYRKGQVPPRGQSRVEMGVQGPAGAQGSSPHTTADGL